MSGVIAPPAIHLRRRSTMEALALDPARELGAGGEARVMAVPGDDSLVAKLYHEPTVAKARKVALMMADEPALDTSAAALAWPRDLLVDERGRFAGFLMERAAGPRVFEFYNPSTRRHAAPRGDYSLLHRVGANVAAAFEALHARGYVIGDVNESNVLVRPGGAVTLVDTDSMQVRDPADGTVHRSRVGKAEFTPPELQGRPFADFDRSPEHDRFGLAVLLFLLLMEGTHPFAGRLEDGGEMPPIEERIRRGLFPHDDHVEIRPPKLAPDFSLLDPGLRALFVRCFEDGHADPSARPTAAEWRAALVAAWAELRKCGKNRFHRFGPHLEACPWCARAALLGGRDPFPARAEPKPERRPRGTNRKGALALRSAPAHPPARSAALAPTPVPASPAPAPAPVAVPVPVPVAAVTAPHPVWGPSGVQHPAAWVVPALVLMFLAPTLIGVLCVLALFGGLRWWLAARPGGRIDRHTVSASAGMLLAALAIVAVARGVVPGQQAAPEPASPPAAVVDPPRPPPAPPGVTAEVIHLATRTTVDDRPELLNREEAERELADRIFHAETHGGWVLLATMLVRPDGTVSRASVRERNRIDREVVEAAAPALAGMRFVPHTRDGVPVAAFVSVIVKYGVVRRMGSSRPSPAAAREAGRG
jgi:hypothetical protein